MRNIITVHAIEDEDWMLLLTIKASRKLKAEGGSGLETLRHWRKYRHMSLESVAAAIGCGASTVKNWEDARHFPSSFWLPQIAEVYHCTIEDLYFMPPDAEK